MTKRVSLAVFLNAIKGEKMLLDSKQSELRTNFSLMVNGKIVCVFTDCHITSNMIVSCGRSAKMKLVGAKFFAVSTKGKRRAIIATFDKKDVETMKLVWPKHNHYLIRS